MIWNCQTEGSNAKSAISNGFAGLTLKPMGPSLLKNKQGSVTILFGFAIMILMMTTGGAIDYARWLHARTLTKTSIDAAVLAGARILQISSLNEAEAIQAAKNYYEENTSKRLDLAVDTIEFQVSEQGTAVTASGEATLNTLVLKLIGVDQLPLLKLSGAEFAKAVLAVGANAEQNLEISLMLDVTGSMDGQKLDDMKAAAKDLIDIVVWEGNAGFTSRVALVPFAEAVMLPDAMFSDVWKGGPEVINYPLASGFPINWQRAGRCISERTGPHALTDNQPQGNPHRFMGAYRWDGACRPQNEVVPLTSDKQYLKATIDGFSATGGTAGHIGTAWSWYMLSPKWKNTLPASSEPAAYSMLSQTNSKGKPLLRKIAVMMTDGEYNAEYCDNGLRAAREDKENFTADCEAANGLAAEQARTLCSNMKAKGITVYTVGFQLAEGGEAEETLSQCATSPDHAYDADNGQQLRQSFRDIALKISELYLNK